MVPLWPEEMLPSPMNTGKVRLYDLDRYHYYCVNFSGGKDSFDILLFLFEQNVPRERIILCNQPVDGEPGRSQLFMDWPVTEEYVFATGKVFGLQVAMQWRRNGFKGELLRENSLTQDVQYIYGGKTVTLPTTKGSISTRRRFPAKSSNLGTRWCSASLKIDCFSRFLANEPTFKGDPSNPLRILVLTGERAEESPARARYPETEVHRCSTKGRIVHHWRPVISWPEEKVWMIMEKHQIVPHPAYILGWSRTSCFGCVFSSPDHWAMMREIAPERFNRLVEMERELNFTIDHKYSLTQLADSGTVKIPYDVLNSRLIKKALQGEFNAEDLIADRWEIPAGAFKGYAGGPT